MAQLGFVDALPRFQPVARELLSGIAEAGSRLAPVWALVRLPVVLPGDFNESIDVDVGCGVIRIGEALAHAPREFLARHRPLCLAFAYLGYLDITRVRHVTFSAAGNCA